MRPEDPNMPYFINMYGNRQAQLIRWVTPEGD